MTRHVLTLDLRDDPEVIAAYRRYHEAIWPEVSESLLGAGVRKMEIFLLGTRLVMILELADGLDMRQVFERHLRSGPRVVEWEQLMKSFQQQVPGAREGEWWAAMEQVFHLADAAGRPDTSGSPGSA
jgi:L-rhamnose mutarotase